MARLTYLSMAVVSVLLVATLAIGTLGWAVREGVANEVLLWFPPGGKYQLILRVGPDALPWYGGGGNGTAINVWAHVRGANRHTVRLFGLPLGSRTETAQRP